MGSSHLENYAKNLLSLLNDQRQQNDYCDVNIISKDGEVFFAHSCVLAANSGVFQASLSNIPTKAPPYELVLPEINSELLATLLDVLYTGTMAIVGDDGDFITRLKFFASELELKSVLDLCEQFVGAQHKRKVGRPAGKKRKWQYEKAPTKSQNTEESTTDPGLTLRGIPRRKSSLGVSKILRREESIKDDGEIDYEISDKKKKGWKKGRKEEKLNDNTIANEMIVDAYRTPGKTRSRNRKMPDFSMIDSESETEEELKQNLLIEDTAIDTGAVEDTFQNIKSGIENLKQSSAFDGEVSSLFEEIKNRLAGHTPNPVKLKTRVKEPATEEERIEWKNCLYCSQFKGRKRGSYIFHVEYCHSPYKCEKCFKPFLNKADAKVPHICKVKTKEPMVCSLCGKTLADDQSLRLHMNVHAGIKNLSCQHCGKRFMRRIHLNAHIIHIHSKIRPHKCKQCDAEFGLKYELNRHMQRHSITPNYKCEMCAEKFFERYKLTLHKRDVHGIKSDNTPIDKPAEQTDIKTDVSQKFINVNLNGDNASISTRQQLIHDAMEVVSAMDVMRDSGAGDGTQSHAVNLPQPVVIQTSEGTITGQGQVVYDSYNNEYYYAVYENGTPSTATT